MVKAKKTGARPSLVAVDLDKLCDLFSARQEPSAAVGEVEEAPKKELAESSAAAALPPDASLVSPPKSPSVPPSPARPSIPHRPAPQLRVFATDAHANAFSVLAEDPDIVLHTECSPDVTPEPRAGLAGSGARGKRGGTCNERNVRDSSPPLADRQDTLPAPVASDAFLPPVTSAPAVSKSSKAIKSKEKETAFTALKIRSENATTFGELANSFKALVQLMKDYRSSAPTVACFEALDALQGRLGYHHEISRDRRSRVQAQHRAVQSLTKTAESIKTVQTVGISSGLTSAGIPASPPKPSVKPKPAPLPSPMEEHILVRCDGEIAPRLQLPYHQMIPEINEILAQLSLPRIVYASHLNPSSLFLVPESKDAAEVLVKSWDKWGSAVFPGARIAPPAVHCHLQVDRIPFAAAGNLNDVAREFEARNPNLGPVTGTPVWVNKPPCEAMIAAAAAAGKKTDYPGGFRSYCRTRFPSSSSHAVLRVLEVWSYQGALLGKRAQNIQHIFSSSLKIFSTTVSPYFTLGSIKVTIINLYNDSATRAGVGLLRGRLRLLDPGAATIMYTLDFDVIRWESTRFNTGKMDLDKFSPSLDIISVSNLDRLYQRKKTLTKLHLSSATPWRLLWKEEISLAIGSSHLARHIWLEAQRDFYVAITQAKQLASNVFVWELERIDLFKALNRLKEHQSTCLVTAPGESEGVHLGDYLLGELPPSADRQDSLPAPMFTSDAIRCMPVDPMSLAETIPIKNEWPLLPVTDSEVDAVIFSSSPWKAADRHGVQMGHIHRTWPVIPEIADRVRNICKASVCLGTKPAVFNANTAPPIHKQGKKDKTSTKAW
ncbi:hypothetical protein C8R43DRAFT_955249 [Mycena crocata]|nr:hypothetical protein C8R43DRAFT_955249 [Mycena crocata]